MMKRFGFFLVLLTGLFGMTESADASTMTTVMTRMTRFAPSSNQDHVSFGNSITVPDGESAGDVVCFFCSVTLRGDVRGDLVTFFGNVDLADGKTVSGDEVAFGGDVKMGEGSRVGGDLVLFGGDLQQASSAMVSGDHVVFAGSGWLLLMLLPFLLPIGVVWLIVYFVRRRRYAFLAYPGGRVY